MGLNIEQKIILVTRPTQLTMLRRTHNTRSQAKFQFVSAKKRELAKVSSAPARELDVLAELAFDDVDQAAVLYDNSVQSLQQELDFADLGLPVQTIDRDFLPNFVFGPHDIVVTVGPDGLVANTAKYTVGLPIVAVNPDPNRIDGLLLPFRPDQARAAVRAAINGKATFRDVTLAEASLGNGQKLLAFNELFIGNRTHVSARYRLTAADRSELQSSSGVLVSTGAGSTGWLSSVFNMAAGIGSLFQNPASPESIRMEWEDPRLIYVVREPFASKSSSANMVAGMIENGQEIIIESEMAANGVIFSDGVESDYIEFNSGSTVRIRTAAGKAKLVTGLS